MNEVDIIRENYLYKEVFIVTSDDKIDLDFATIGVADGFDNLLEYISEHNEEDNLLNNMKLHHGILIPVKFLHSKINRLTSIFLLTVNRLGTIYDNVGKKEKEKEKTNKNISIKGGFQEITPFMTMNDVKNAVNKSFALNHCAIEDLFLLLGYEVMITAFDNISDAIDESELLEGSSIADLTKETLEVLDEAEVVLCQDFALGRMNENKYTNVKHLFGNNFSVGC